MLSKVYTGALHGLEAKPVIVETDLSPGLPSLSMVGLPDITVREAGARIRSAILNSGFKFPAKRITINLSPANTRKEGSHFDLPIAVGVLSSIGEVEKRAKRGYAFIGELSLTGEINGIDGVLPLVIGLKDCGIKKIILPADNIREAGLVKNVELYPARRLRQVVEHLSGTRIIRPLIAEGKIIGNNRPYDQDYKDVAGQENVKRAITVSCAGRHGILLVGVPGIGKSMVAKRMPTVLPEMSYEECLEVTKIYSIGGELSSKQPMITQRPFRTPHHTISRTAMVGGGNKPKPGELSLAHFGVLFLDEISEFGRNVLDSLRQPLEDNIIDIARVGGKYSFPCDVMLVAAGNPCPCGYFGSKTNECTCSQTQINNYRSKLSGPLMDRIDLHVEMVPPQYEQLEGNEMDSNKKRTSSADMRKAVERARKMQQERYKNERISFNSQLTSNMKKNYCGLKMESRKMLEAAFKTMNLSARAYDKIVKISRTIADLEESESIELHHVAEALSYRMNYNKI